MGFDLAPKLPKQAAPMPPPPAAHPAVLGSLQVQQSGDTAKKAAAAAEGMGESSTVKTSPQGLEAPKTAKTILGG